MNRRLICTTFLTVMLSTMLAGSSFAGAIYDFAGDPNAYWGGTISRGYWDDWGDAITLESQYDPGQFYYDVNKLAVQSLGNQTVVTLTGYYFYAHMQGYADAQTYSPGDLYISTSGWNASDSSEPHYGTDTFTPSEGWNYVVSFVNGGFGAVHNLDFSKITYSSNLGLTNNVYYRMNQAWTGGYGAEVSSGATAVLYGGTDANHHNDASLTFTYASLPGDPDSFGYHWTMGCGNDVIEGTPVPEPSTLVLLGSGLLGILSAGKLRFPRK